MMKLNFQYKLLPILIHSLGLGTLYFDWLFYQNFQIEEIYLISLTLLISIKLISYCITKFKINYWVFGLINFSLIGISLYNFGILAITLFGFTYTTGSIPLIWFFVCVSSLGIFTISIMELIKKINK